MLPVALNTVSEPRRKHCTGTSIPCGRFKFRTKRLHAATQSTHDARRKQNAAEDDNLKQENVGHIFSLSFVLFSNFDSKKPNLEQDIPLHVVLAPLAFSCAQGFWRGDYSPLHSATGRAVDSPQTRGKRGGHTRTFVCSVLKF